MWVKGQIQGHRPPSHRLVQEKAMNLYESKYFRSREMKPVLQSTATGTGYEATKQMITVPEVLRKRRVQRITCHTDLRKFHNPYPTAFPYGNGMVLHFYQQQESSTTETVHKIINKRLKTYV